MIIHALPKNRNSKQCGNYRNSQPPKQSHAENNKESHGGYGLCDNPTSGRVLSKASVPYCRHCSTFSWRTGETLHNRQTSISNGRRPISSLCFMNINLIAGTNRTAPTARDFTRADRNKVVAIGDDKQIPTWAASRESGSKRWAAFSIWLPPSPKKAGPRQMSTSSSRQQQWQWLGWTGSGSVPATVQPV